MAFHVQQAAVLGAGVMGAQIAAHLANAGIRVLLFDLPADGGERSAIAQRAIERLHAMHPPPLAAVSCAQRITPANYDEDLTSFGGCDLVIEAVAERLEIKRSLYTRIAPHLGETTVLATNTSGLSIEKLADAVPEERRARFCGIHFFNPPRLMRLVELIGASTSSSAVLDDAETFLTTTLGKGVIRAHDTPNFIGNRIGLFALIAAMHHAERLGLGFDTVDELTGPLIGRPRSATFGTLDLIGLDTFRDILASMRDALRDDPWHGFFRTPTWLDACVARGALGRKSGRGIYVKGSDGRTVFDAASDTWRAYNPQVAEEIREARALEPMGAAEWIARVRSSSHPQSTFLWSVFRDLFHYCAFHLGSIADCARDLDLAMRWGFAWRAGPFETWQAAGWSALADAIRRDIEAGRAMVRTPLPDWVGDGREGVHAPAGSYSPATGGARRRSGLPVYQSQVYPEIAYGEMQADGKTMFQTPAVRLWLPPEPGDGSVGVLSFKTKLAVVSEAVLEGLEEAIGLAERELAGLVLWQPAAPFSVGADLKAMHAAAVAGDFGWLDRFLVRFQALTGRLRTASVPVVAAVEGAALGGGCEIAMHASRVVAALESQIGLVEARVGLIPAGGGSKELAWRAARLAGEGGAGRLVELLTAIHARLAQAFTSRSALEAREAGFLSELDPIVFHPRELLHLAIQQVGELRESGYQPASRKDKVPVAGRPGIEALMAWFEKSSGQGACAEHEYTVARALATALCGGTVDAGTLLDQQALLDTERAIFLELIRTAETQARIEQVIHRGKRRQ